MHTLNIRMPCDAESGCRSDGMNGPRLWVCEGVSEEGVFRIQEFNKLKHGLGKIKHSFNVSTLQLDLFLVIVFKDNLLVSLKMDAFPLVSMHTRKVSFTGMYNLVHVFSDIKRFVRKIFSCHF